MLRNIHEQKVGQITVTFSFSTALNPTEIPPPSADWKVYKIYSFTLVISDLFEVNLSNNLKTHSTSDQLKDIALIFSPVLTEEPVEAIEHSRSRQKH